MSSPEGSSVLFRGVRNRISRAAIERFAQKLQREVARRRAFDTLITTDAELQRLNREFRGKDQPTDVLSFPGGAGIEPARGRGKLAAPRLGDLAISLQRARAQAREFGHSTEQEVQLLMLHGVLHLIGLDHETDDGKMARAERRWRAHLGLPNGVIERVSS